ncbi:MAG: glycosyltransferase family 2 protein [Magnetococcales bacterium]|nr:glycosyltransferase family 2 protein [Magnetococcales bacterium]
MERKKKISVVIPCLNEEENVEPMRDTLREIFAQLPQYELEILFIDNFSTDNTRAILRRMAAEDRCVKAIFNARNFGTVRSPQHGLLQATGDAVIMMAADFQEPPALIPSMLAKWQEGAFVVMAVRERAMEGWWMQSLRKSYYYLISKVSDVEQIRNFNGSSLLDRKVVEIIRQMDDPYPYFRGMLAEIGLPSARIPFVQPKRRAGRTKNNYMTLYDMAITGITSHAKAPLRLMVFFGFIMAACSVAVAFGYLLYKLFNWEGFQLGLAPLVVGQFFINGIILIILGFMMEYIGSINMRLFKRPLVVELERINFEQEHAAPESADRMRAA